VGIKAQVTGGCGEDSGRETVPIFALLALAGYCAIQGLVPIYWGIRRRQWVAAVEVRRSDSAPPSQFPTGVTRQWRLCFR
jgi:hypothetical protein